DETTPYSQFDDRTEQRIRAAIGDAAFDEAFQAGAAYSFDQAVTLALGEETERDRAAKPGMAGRLTRREHQIAVLIGDGLSNREIAARLVISQRTAETHVEHILSKLGFASRAQVASWVTEQRAR
ncbi:MAG: response regulator transcription factor, partial [Nocardioidaceae bacterium]